MASTPETDCSTPTVSGPLEESLVDSPEALEAFISVVRQNDDLRWLATQGVEVVRHNPAQDPHPFLTGPLVRQAMQDGGEAVLPLVTLDDEEKSRQRYPAREELAAWTKLSPTPNDDTTCCGESSCC